MKTETQDFVNLQDYEGSPEAEQVTMRLYDILGEDIDIVFNDMYEKLGKVTTDEKVEAYLEDSRHIEDVVGWKCLQYESRQEQDEEERLAWEEITDWDDR